MMASQPIPCTRGERRFARICVFRKQGKVPCKHNVERPRNHHFVKRLTFPLFEAGAGLE